MMELRIKEVAKEQGKTIVTLAEMVGITQPNMSNIVNCKTMPSLETLEKIASALNVPITELFAEKKDGAILSCPHCGKDIIVKAN